MESQRSYQVARKIFLHSTTRQCEINHHQTTQTKNFLLENGHQIVDNALDATDIILMTCGALQSSEEASLQLISESADQCSEKKNLFILGCLPKILPDLPIYKRATVLGPKELYRLNESFSKEVKFEDSEALKIDYKFVNVGEEHNRFTIVVAQGCIFNCTFCAIKNAKEGITSEDESKIVRLFEKICENNQQPTISLLGEDFGSYGLDKKTNAAILLDKLTITPGDYSIEIQNFEPSRFIKLYDKLRPILARGKVTRIHIALQSGSQKILDAMKRHYNIEQTKAVLEDLIENLPEVSIEASFIINYPGEERSDFFKSLKFFPMFDEVVVFNYNPRRGTPAWGLKDSISDSEKEFRINMIKELQSVHPGLIFEETARSRLDYLASKRTDRPE
tara:strand:- start:1647 stop:2822 length:1176 start_codon:yes stop_codon:yes gene_type:complete